MDDFKGLLASKTFWGGLIAVLAGILSFFGYEIAGPDQAQIVEIGAAIAASVGGIIAIFGRIKASKKIGKEKKA